MWPYNYVILWFWQAPGSGITGSHAESPTRSAQNSGQLGSPGFSGAWTIWEMGFMRLPFQREGHPRMWTGLRLDHVYEGHHLPLWLLSYSRQGKTGHWSSLRILIVTVTVKVMWMASKCRCSRHLMSGRRLHLPPMICLESIMVLLLIWVLLFHWGAALAPQLGFTAIPFTVLSLPSNLKYPLILCWN